MFKKDDSGWGRYTDVVVLTAATNIGAADNTWVDQGAEIDMRGYNKAMLWVTLVVNDSTGNQLQILSKHTSAGAGEYVLPSATLYQHVLGDSNILIAIPFETNGTIPFIQIQTKATDVAVAPGVTIGTVAISVTKGWS